MRTRTMRQASRPAWLRRVCRSRPAATTWLRWRGSPTTCTASTWRAGSTAALSSRSFARTPTAREIEQFVDEARGAAQRAGDEVNRAFFRQHGTVVWSH